MADSLEQIAGEVSGCTRCPLHETRNRSVPGEGPSNAQIMLIGEGPGFHEDQSGRPFVGAAGNFLVELLGSVGMKREDVFICNVVKCRPPNNRDPEPIEIQSCQDYLDRQIELINPKLIVTLGRYSMARWFPDARISHVHGKPRQVGDRVIVPMYHPAAALHQPSLKQQVIDDFKKLPQFLEQAKQHISDSNTDTDTGSEDDSTPPQAQQLSLF